MENCLACCNPIDEVGIDGTSAANSNQVEQAVESRQENKGDVEDGGVIKCVEQKLELELEVGYPSRSSMSPSRSTLILRPFIADSKMARSGLLLSEILLLACSIRLQVIGTVLIPVVSSHNSVFMILLTLRLGATIDARICKTELDRSYIKQVLCQRAGKGLACRLLRGAWYVRNYCDFARLFVRDMLHHFEVVLTCC